MSNISKFYIPALCLLLLMAALSFAQDYEEQITQFSEKFLTNSQSFVKYASQNVNTETEYNAALEMSDIAEEFYQHASYLGDFLLILKIINKHPKEKQLAERLVKLRIKSVITKCDAAMQGVKSAMADAKSESITTMANKLTSDLEALRAVLNKINHQYSGK